MKLNTTVNVSAPHALRNSVGTITVPVRVSGLWRVRLGLALIRLGMRLAGIERVRTEGGN